MPNWSHNKVKIEGQNEMLERFVAAQAGPAVGQETGQRSFTFNAQVPVPVKVVRNGFWSSDPEVMDQRTWQTEHWGTDRDVNDFDLEIERAEGEITLRFNTAWSPPYHWMREVSRLWPELTMTLEFFVIEMRYSAGYSFRAGEDKQEWEKDLVFEGEEEVI